MQSPKNNISNEVLGGLSSEIPDLEISRQPEDLTEYGRDWTRLYPPEPCGIAFPRSEEQILRLVRWANSAGVALVPSGGRTGLSGGAVAAKGELVVSMARMDRLLEFDPVDRTLTVEAGMITEKIQQLAAENGLMFPVDFAAKGSSQIGGNLATNAGGVKVLRYGLTRDWVVGMRVVTGAGELLDVNRGLIKNATGYDLRHLFIGSEGTLGIIVSVTLRLAEPPPSQSVMVVGLEGMDPLMQVFDLARESLTLSAFEFFSDLALSYVIAEGSPRAPFESRMPYYALLEFDCVGEDGEAAALAFFERCLEEGWIGDGVLSQSEAQAAELWSLREFISERISAKTPYKNDLSTRISQVPAFLHALEDVVLSRYPDFEVVWYGHIGDGNLHLNILKPDDLSLAEFKKACESVNEEIFGVVARFRGSVSAEHGVGLLKQPYLDRSRDPHEIHYLSGIKRVFDPNWILNPGKMLPEA
ncbi:MAG: FAD-binding oxidoreductase [Xanthomonadales bacterium]|nr:FAD-binding oxidoreductase [Xanthomonadales bacterium]